MSTHRLATLYPSTDLPLLATTDGVLAQSYQGAIDPHGISTALELLDDSLRAVVEH